MDDLPAKIASALAAPRELLDYLNDGVVLHEVASETSPSSFVQVNDAICRMLGYSAEEMRRLSPLDILQPEDLPKVPQDMAVLLRTGVLLHEKVLSAKDGRKIPTEINTRLFEHQGKQMIVSIVRDVSERVQAEEALRRYELLAGHSRDVILFLQRDSGRILEANTAASLLYGYSHEELLGLTIHDLRASQTHPLTADQLAEADARGLLFETLHRTKDGSAVPVEVSSRGATIGETRTLISIVRDITERKRAEKALVAAKAAAEDASRAKDHFLAVLSHELRTPLTPVLTAAQMMESEPQISDEQRELVAMIRRNVELEARLIDDLLDLTRIARGKLELNLSLVDVHEKLHQVAAMCQEDLRAKQHRLTVETSAAHHLVHGDPARLQQVFWNLLKNAIKFTPDGGSIAVRTNNPTRGEVSVSVQDDGIGIEAELLPSIFNAFEQGGAATTRQFGGLGLGLAISKGLVVLHGGRIEAQSEGAGKGSTFTLTLKTHADLHARHSAPLADGDSSSVKRHRILLVEDHADTAELLARVLRKVNYEVCVAGSVAAALEIARGEAFDLLVSDIGLPDGSGVELMRELSRMQPIKGIALSGYGMEADLQRSKEVGFSTHLVKPVEIGKLRTTVREVLAKS